MIQEDTIIKSLKTVVEETLNHYHFRVHNVFNLVNWPHWNIPKRKITDWMLVYARGGKGYYEIDGVRHSIEEGKIFFISNDVFHCAAQEELFRASVIAVRFGLYDNNSNSLVVNKLDPWGFSCKINRYSYYQQLFENIYSYFKLYPGQVHLSLCNTLLSQVFNLLYLKMTEVFNSTGMDKRLEKAKLFVEENILDELPLDKVAKYVQLSPKYFSKLFRQYYKSTYKEYVFKVKMNYAKFLLEETDYPIKKIAYLLGYSDQYIFSNQFKRLKGVSPSKIRGDM